MLINSTYTYKRGKGKVLNHEQINEINAKYSSTIDRYVVIDWFICWLIVDYGFLNLFKIITNINGHCCHLLQRYFTFPIQYIYFILIDHLNVSYVINSGYIIYYAKEE